EIEINHRVYAVILSKLLLSIWSAHSGLHVLQEELSQLRQRLGGQGGEFARGGVRICLGAVPRARDDRADRGVVEAPAQRQLRKRVARWRERLQLLDH